MSLTYYRPTIFYQQSVSHFLPISKLRHFHHSERGLLVTEVLFSVCANRFSIGLAQFYFLFLFLCM